MLNIPEEFFTNMTTYFDIYSILNSGVFHVKDEINKETLENLKEPLENTLMILKLKLILIYEKKSTHCDFSIMKLIERYPDAALEDIYELVLHSLLIQDSTNELEKLLDSTYSNIDCYEGDTDLILRNLLMVEVILEISYLTDYDYFKKIGEENRFHDYVLKLISRSENEINKKLVLTTIPKYLEYKGDEQILVKLWEKFQNEKVMYDLISGLEEYFIPDYNDRFSVLKEPKFWENLQTYICDKDPVVRREMLYTLKKAVSVLTSEEYSIEAFPVDANGIPLVGCATLKEMYSDAWDVFFECCDSIKEKSLHLIEPVLGFYDAMDVLHISWRKCITKLCLQHSHRAVVTYTINKVLNCSWPAETQDLIQALNNDYLYDKPNKIGRELLLNYLNSLTQEDLVQFVNDFLKITPAPYSFLNICSALQQSVIEVHDLKLLRSLIELAKNVPHLYLRAAATKQILGFLKRVPLCINEEFIDDLMNILCGCFEFGRVYDSYLGVVPAWIEQIGDENYEVFIKHIVVMKMENEPVKKVKGCAIFIALSSQVKKTALQSVFNRRYFEKIDKLSKDQRMNYLIFTAQIIRLVEQCVVKVPVESHFISYILLRLMSACCSIPVHEQDSAFVENVTMAIGIAMHIYNDMEKMGLISNFIRQLVESENHTGCLLLSTTLLQYYPFFKFNADCQNKVYYLEQIKMLEENLNESKRTILCQSGYVREKHRMMSNYYESMLVLRKLEIEADDEDEVLKTAMLKELPTYLDLGGPTVILRILECISATLTFEWEMSENFNIACTKILRSCQYAVLSMKTNHIFNSALTKFLIVLIQPAMKCTKEIQQVATDTFNMVFKDESISSEHRVEILYNLKSRTDFEILYQAFVYGPALRTDKRGPDDNMTLRVRAVCILFNKLSEGTSDDEHYCYNLMCCFLNGYDEFYKKRYFSNSKIHLKKLRILQGIHLLVKSQRPYVLLDLYKKCIDYLVNESNQLDVKILIQWLLVKIIKRVEDRQSEIIDKLIKLLSKIQKPTWVIQVLYHILKWKSVDIKTVEIILEKLIGCAMGIHFVVRYFAQEAIKHICVLYGADIMNKYENVYRVVCKVQENTKVNTTAKDFTLGFCTLDTSLETLYKFIPIICNLESEAITPRYFSNYGCVPFPSYIPLHSTNNDLHAMVDSVFEFDDSEILTEERARFIQRKVQGADEKVVKSGNLIVVASLLTCKPNLGGLSRTCEVLGVKEYVISNLSILQSPDYKNLSKTSENWLKITEVKVADLPKYLKDMKKKGYRIVGAEQTRNSTNLNNYAFDKNSVLVLGNEKLGIPPNLLHILDDCIEIPQTGQLRSLNVHITGSLCIWEYVKQH